MYSQTDQLLLTNKTQNIYTAMLFRHFKPNKITIISREYLLVIIQICLLMNISLRDGVVL